MPIIERSAAMGTGPGDSVVDMKMPACRKPSMFRDPLDVVAARRKGMRPDQDGQVGVAASPSRLAPPSDGIEQARRQALTMSSTRRRAARRQCCDSASALPSAFQQQLRRRLVDALDRAPRRPGDGRDHRRHRPRHRRAAFNRNPDRPGRGIVVGNGAHTRRSASNARHERRTWRWRPRPRRISRLIEHRTDEQRRVADADGIGRPVPPQMSTRRAQEDLEAQRRSSGS